MKFVTIPAIKVVNEEEFIKGNKWKWKKMMKEGIIIIQKNAV